MRAAASFAASIMMIACCSLPPERSAEETPATPRSDGISSASASSASSVSDVPPLGDSVAITTAAELILKLRTTGVTPSGRFALLIPASTSRRISLTSLP